MEYENLSKEELIKHLYKLNNEKRYGLIWEIKPEIVDELLEKNFPVLTNYPSNDIMVDPNKNVNLLIEGDNLHTLYLLNTTHNKKIDCILIDPPYNTGNKDFIYDDQYVDSEDAWRHSKWISFMNRRLSLARKLLKDDGVIFIHIDENEFAQLKLLCDEIFGRDNFLGVFIWKARSGKGGTNSQIAHEHEYIFSYAKDSKKAKIKTIQKIGAERTEQLRQWGQEFMREDRPYMFFPILFKPEENITSTISDEEYTQIYNAELDSFNDDFINKLRTKYEGLGWKFILPVREEGFGRWRVGLETAKELLKNNEIIFREEDGVFSPYRVYPEGNITESAIGSLILDKGTASDGTKELKKIFGEKIFDTTKPIDTTMYLLDSVMFNKDQGIVLDFFAGSGTTGETVMQYNKKYNKEIQFILSTNNELKEKEKNKLLKQGIGENSEEFKNKGVCRKVTFPKLKAVIEGYDFEGETTEILKEVKLNITNLKKMNKIFEEFEEIKQSHPDFDRFENKASSDKLFLLGKKMIHGKTEGLNENLKYYFTDVIEKSPNLDQMKVIMVRKINDLLCIRENCFEIVVDSPHYKIYKKGDKLLGVYSSFLNLHFDEFKHTFLSIEAVTRVIYSFSFTDSLDYDLIKDIETKVRIEAIPTQIIEMLDELRK